MHPEDLPMRTIIFAAACAASTLAFLPAARAAEAASASCPTAGPVDACAAAPATDFRPEADVRALVEKFLRYRVDRVQTKGGCYAVHASDRSGTPYVVTFRGNDLRMISRYPAKDAQ
jgi:hypothetical protein